MISVSQSGHCDVRPNESISIHSVAECKVIDDVGENVAPALQNVSDLVEIGSKVHLFFLLK